MLRIAYLLEDSAISGGVRVVLAQADALIERGHQVTVFSKGERPPWRTTHADWQRVGHFGEVRGSDFDFVIGTFWPTVRAAWEIAGNRAVHLCQGFEGSFSFYQHLRSEIEEVYRLPIPVLVVSAHLADIVHAFHDDVTTIGQIVDDAFFDLADGDRVPRRLLLPGPWEVDLKGVDHGYRAVRIARDRGVEIDLVRVSPWPPKHEEPTSEAFEMHIGLDTSAMANLYASCDLFLGPNLVEEGFGLPAAEAMAAGIPAIVSAIPSLKALASKADYAWFAAPGDPESIADGIATLVRGQGLRTRLRNRGREVAQQFRAAGVAERIERFLRERKAVR